MYSRAAVLILDDVLSSVDTSTGRHIIEHCFLSPDMSNRTIIIASHAIESLAPISHRAVFLANGTLVWTGTGPDLLATEYMSHLVSRDSVMSASGEITSIGKGVHGETPESGEQTPKTVSAFEIRRSPAKTPRQILVDEKRAGGVVDAHYWIELVRLCGGRLFLFTFVLLTLGSILGPVAESALLR